MNSTLPATHLLRHFALFLFTVLFLLTMTRAAYVLWQFPAVLESNSLLPVFLFGLRFDLALVGILLLPTILLGCLFGMFRATRAIAKGLVAFLLIFGMSLVLLAELLTPYFMAEQGIRPDLPALSAISDPVSTLASLWGAYLIPAIIGTVLVVLIIVAYIARLELSRMLRFRLSRVSTPFLLIIGLILCLWAVYSQINPAIPPLSPSDAAFSSETVVNEIATNSAYKMLYSVVSPFLR